MNPEFVERLYLKHQECPSCPTKDEVIGFFEKLLGVLFPIYSKQDFNSVRALDFYMINLKEELYEILYAKPNEEGLRAENNTQLFFDALPALYGLLRMDISAMYEGDPAAKSEDEIIRTYPGFYAIAAYRIAHYLHGLGVLVIPRMITEHAHSLTG